MRAQAADEEGTAPAGAGREADAYAEARRVAATRVKLVRDLFHFAIVVGLLLIFLRPLGFIVGLFWGIGLANDVARNLLEPWLRQRWIERAVASELHRTVPARRREIEGEHARRLEQLAAGVAHEIRNPITAAKSLVQQMGEDPASAQNVRSARVALDELDRVERSISHLLQFAREEEMRAEEIRLDEIVSSAVEVFRDRTQRAGIRVTVRCQVDGPLWADGEKLRRVVVNLIGNACEALEGAGSNPRRIEIEAGQNLAGKEVWLRIRDNGPGIEPERLQRIFSPFYTSKEAGTGLGLALSKKVVEAHGGSIEAVAPPDGGTEFLVTLPRRGAAPEARPA